MGRADRIGGPVKLNDGDGKGRRRRRDGRHLHRRDPVPRIRPSTTHSTAERRDSRRSKHLARQQLNDSGPKRIAAGHNGSGQGLGHDHRHPATPDASIERADPQARRRAGRAAHRRGRLHVRLRRRVRDDPPAGAGTFGPAGGAVRRRCVQALAAAVVLLPPADGPAAAARAARPARAGAGGADGQAAARRRDQHHRPRAVRASPALEELVAYHDLRFTDGTYLYDEVRAAGRGGAQRAGSSHYASARSSSWATRRRTPSSASTARSSLRRRQRPSSAEEWLHANRREIAAAAHRGARPRQLSRAGGRGVDRQVLQLLRARPGRHRLGRGADRRRAASTSTRRCTSWSWPTCSSPSWRRTTASSTTPSSAPTATCPPAGSAVDARGVQRELREIRVDFARLSDELTNITKFFGDWHLARIYQGLSRPLPPRRLAPHDRREAQDPRRPLPAAPRRAEQPLDAHPRGDDRPAVHHRPGDPLRGAGEVAAKVFCVCAADRSSPSL